MSGIGKVFVVLNLVFSLVIVGAAAAYLSKADEWKTQYDVLNDTYSKEKTQWEERESEITTLWHQEQQNSTRKQNQIDDLELRNTELQDQIKSEQVNSQQLRDDVTRISSSLDSLRTTINDLRGQNETLVTQNAEYRNAKLDAEQKQNQAEENLIRVQGELNMTREQVEELEMRVTKLDQDKEHLANILEVAKQQGFDISSVVAMPEISAFVQEVNNELGYVILSVGSDDKVKKGYTFQVFRGNTYLGEVQVDDVAADYCTARITFKADGAQFQINDKATTIL